MDKIDPYGGGIGEHEAHVNYFLNQQDLPSHFTGFTATKKCLGAILI